MKPTTQLVIVAKEPSPSRAWMVWMPKPKPKKKPQIGNRIRKKR